MKAKIHIKISIVSEDGIWKRFSLFSGIITGKLE